MISWLKWHFKEMNWHQSWICELIKKVKQERIPLAYTPPASVNVLGGVCLGGVCLGGVCLGCVCPGGCLPTGCLLRGLSTRRCTPATCPSHAGIHTPPMWTEWLTDRCKNITFPQLRFWAVTIIARELCWLTRTTNENLMATVPEK